MKVFKNENPSSEPYILRLSETELKHIWVAMGKHNKGPVFYDHILKFCLNEGFDKAVTFTEY